MTTILNQSSREIRADMRRAFAELLKQIEAGTLPQDAIAAVLAEFEGEYYGVMKKALQGLMGATMTISEVKAWPINGVTLSRKLYRNHAQVSAVTKGLIREHTKGLHSSRKLALELYEGYRFRTTEALDISAKMPRYFRGAFKYKAEFSKIVAQNRAAALRTPALKAAYTEALDALDAGEGAEMLAKKLNVAFHERNRYFANRIAQTELKRVHSEQLAEEWMGEPRIQIIQIRLSQTHPERDICDLHSNLDAYDMGKGVYPKESAPQTPFHPHCRCLMSPRVDLDRADVKPRSDDAERDYVDKLTPQQGARVSGSYAKRQDILNGKKFDDVINGKSPKEYHLKRLGDGKKVVVSKTERAT
ncbi:MAG: hypothetical protein GY862_25355 [Gammaproteobacteria bacterium]|nr:hypothetical protein [Gammaproteobacteria bacterium]